MRLNSGLIFLFIVLIASCKETKTKYNFYLHEVRARENTKTNVWRTYKAKTIERRPEYKSINDITMKEYGKNRLKKEATGFFRVEKSGDRWWLIDPDGYLFIHKGVAVFRPGRSKRQKESLEKKYGSKNQWVKQESQFIKSHGFNGTGAWSDIELIRDNNIPLVYTIIVNPMGSYKREHKKKYGGKYEETGWQGYRFDLAMVFDPEFDEHIEKEISKISKYKDDKYLLGYYTDNELPWINDALHRHLTKLEKTEAGYIAARVWFDNRKGTGLDISGITPEDELAFSGYYFETYMKKVTKAIRKYDPNHLYLGCRFNQEDEELNNPEIFRVAGKYMDVISINHYRKWEPEQKIMKNWSNWSGKPFIITEWYTKGEDSGLPNNTGAGWNVPTQRDRGYFYQNFVIELLKSKACVGWHWFTYQDNDPEDLTTDPSNRNSNKGIVNSNYEPYQDLLDNMKVMNLSVYDLIKYLDGKSAKFFKEEGELEMQY